MWQVTYNRLIMSTKAPRKATKHSTTKKAAAPQKVDYYPNRMTLAVSALAGTLIVLLALIAVLGAR